MSRESFLTSELVVSEIAKCSRFAAEEAADKCLRTVTNRLSTMKLESPLEAAFAAWWMTITDVAKPGLVLESQVEILVDNERFRADFVIREERTSRIDPTEVLPILAVVELDGHQFHEKTPEQVARRNHRDRMLQKAGYHVVHFSFSELVNDGYTCVIQASHAAWSRWIELGQKGTS